MFVVMSGKLSRTGLVVKTQSTLSLNTEPKINPEM